MGLVEEIVILTGFDRTGAFLGGLMVALMVTMPEKRLKLVAVRVIAPTESFGRVWEDGLAEMVKSGAVEIVAVKASWSTQPNVGSTVSQAFRLSAHIG